MDSALSFFFFSKVLPGSDKSIICYPCMEKALGRKLTYDDLIGKDVPLNMEFKEKVLKPRIQNNPPEN